MLERYKIFQFKPNSIDELKKDLQSMWDDVPQNPLKRHKPTELC